MSVKLANIMSRIREDVGDPSGVHPLWTDTVILKWIVRANRHFSQVTGCIDANEDLALVAGTNQYTFGGEAIMNTPDAAWIVVSGTYNDPLEYRDPWSTPNWGQLGRPRYWGIETMQGTKYFIVAPIPDGGYTARVHGVRVSNDQGTDGNRVTDLPEPVAYEARHLVKCRLYQMTGDVQRARMCRDEYWGSVRRGRQAYRI